MITSLLHIYIVSKFSHSNLFPSRLVRLPAVGRPSLALRPGERLQRAERRRPDAGSLLLQRRRTDRRRGVRTPSAARVQLSQRAQLLALTLDGPRVRRRHSGHVGRRRRHRAPVRQHMRNDLVDSGRRSRRPPSRCYRRRRRCWVADSGDNQGGRISVAGWVASGRRGHGVVRRTISQPLQSVGAPPVSNDPLVVHAMPMGLDVLGGVHR